MKPMKHLLTILAISGSLLFGAKLTEVQAVYVMPMTRGMDQFLASRLSAEKVVRVVTDPKLADAFLTDRIGDALSRQLDDISAPPAPDANTENSGAAAARLDDPSLRSSFGRGKGTFFLVDAKTREVVWSTFENPKDSAPSSLNRSASEIVKRLKKAWK